MLALVRATKYLRCYLYGNKFVVRADHEALAWLHKFAENNRRLMRWSLRLTEFDFVVEHPARKKIPRVDALSRHIGLVQNNPTLHRQDIEKEQDLDPFFIKQKSRGSSKKSKYFLDSTGVTYRRQRAKEPQIIVPATLEKLL
jgi:hypothetical protein